MSMESAETVYGRLLESAHISGYSFNRACDELLWLLEEDRWKRIGRGFEEPNELAQRRAKGGTLLAATSMRNPFGPPGRGWEFSIAQNLFEELLAAKGVVLPGGSQKKVTQSPSPPRATFLHATAKHENG